MLCPIRDCEEKGVLSLTKELGLESKTIDSPLLFCRDHFCDMYIPHTKESKTCKVSFVSLVTFGGHETTSTS